MMKIIYYLFVAVLFTSMMACSDDEPQIITETITVRDTITVIQHDTTVVTQVDTSIIIIRDTTVIVQVDTIVEMISDDSTVVVICVRHAETSGGGSDPSLSIVGQQRSEDLAHALSNLQLSNVYSSNFNRTKQTANTTALDQGLPVEIYNAFNIPLLASGFLDDHKGQTVLAVGHSNTTPELINSLTGTTNYMNFDEGTYDNLFIVSIKSNGEATVYHLEYGADTP